LNLKVNLDAQRHAGSAYPDYLSPKGIVLLSTAKHPVAYTPNANPALGGTFSGGIEIDPDDFAVQGDGNYKIYWSSAIGDEFNLANDAIPGLAWNATNLTMLGDTSKYMLMPQGYTDFIHGASLSKTTTRGMTKAAVNAAVIDEVGYRLKMNAATDPVAGAFQLDVLPFNGDGRGSAFHGGYTLKDGKVTIDSQSASPPASSAVEAYHTTDSAIRTAGSGGTVPDASIFSGVTPGQSFSAGGVTWQKAADNGDGTWTVGSKPAAIAVAGTVAGNEQVVTTFALTLSGYEGGDAYGNTASMIHSAGSAAQVSPGVRATVATRQVSGKAWLDKDEDGVFGAGDAYLENVGVRLYEQDGTTQIAADASGAAYGTAGTVKTASDGSYSFGRVPSAAGYIVRFVGTNGFAIGNHTVTAKFNYGAGDPYFVEGDSDVSPTGTPLAYAQTDAFTMKSDAQLIADGTAVDQRIGVDAGFIPVKYTVTYHGTGSTGGKAPVDAASPYYTGSEVTILDKGSLLKANHALAGWDTDKAASTAVYKAADIAAGNAKFTITANTDLYPVWVEDGKFTVTYHGTGSTGGKAPVDAASPYYTGSEVTVAGKGALVKANHAFAGWDTDKAASTAVYKAADIAAGKAKFTITANTDLYPVWVEDGKYTVTYHANGGTGGSVPADTAGNAPGGNAYYAGSKVTVLFSPLPTRPGWTFLGWAQKGTDTKPAYTAAGNKAFNISGNTILYAIWSENNAYQVNYDTNGGTPAKIAARKNVRWADAGLLPAQNPARAGAAFAGWKVISGGKNADGTGKAGIVGGDKYADLAKSESTGAITLQAQWAVKSYTVTYHGNGNTSGAVPKSITMAYGSTWVASAQGNMAKAGYAFIGWSTDAAAGKVTHHPGAANTLAGDVHLYAVWSYNGGDKPVTPVKPPQKPVTPPAEKPATPPAEKPATPPEKPVAPPEKPVAPPVSHAPDNNKGAAQTPAPKPDEPKSIEKGFSRADADKIEAQTGNPLTDLLGGNVPLGNIGAMAVWSLLSLIMSAIAVAIAILLAIGAMLRRREEEEDERLGDCNSEEEEKDRKRQGLLKILACACGALTLIVWLILDDLTLPMAWINKWTIVVGVVFAMHLALFILYKVNSGNRRDENEDEPAQDSLV
jgi:uncharacterized repeat protein (TIGR02543 family)